MTSQDIQMLIRKAQQGDDQAYILLFEHATDEVSLKVEKTEGKAESIDITISAALTKPNEIRYKGLQQLDIGKYEITTASGTVIPHNQAVFQAETTTGTEHPSTLRGVIKFDKSYVRGDKEYYLHVYSFVASIKADAPLEFVGDWKIPFRVMP